MQTAASPVRSAALLRKLSSLRPELALVLGTGLQSVVSEVQIEDEVPFQRVPGFPPVRVEGQSGKILFGHLGRVPVLALCGRAHFYEGHEMSAVTFPVRVLAEFGIRHLLLTNAAGGINRRFRAGDFMCLTDHINLMGTNPLRGEFGGDKTPFVDLSRVYDPVLRELMQQAARETQVRLHRGIYLAVSGPSYETPAEIRAFARLGADAVGMSTVPEAIVARQCGLAVAGLSCITNLAAGQNRRPLSHSEVLATAEQVGPNAARLLRRFVELSVGQP